MARDIAADIRLDPRVKAFLADDEGPPEGDVDSRETLLAEANSEQARAGAEEFRRFMERFDTEETAPSAGLTVTEHGSSLNLTATRSTSSSSAPTLTSASVRVLHPRGRDGGHVVLRRQLPGMGSAHRRPRPGRRDGRLPQCLVPSSVPEVAPFPAGLNDCVSRSQVGRRQCRRARIDPARDRCRRRERRREPDPGHGSAPQAGWRPRPRQGSVRAGPYIAGHGPRRDSPPRPRTTASSSSAQQPRPRCSTGSRPSTARNPLAWPGSRRTADVGVSCRPSSASTSATRCATRASTSTGCSCGRGDGPLPSGDGHHPRDRDLHDRLPGDQP